MKRYCLLLSAMVALTGAAFASSATAINIGYCEGQVNKRGNSDFCTDEAPTWVSEAIFIPAEKMQLYAGNRIEEMMAGVSATVNIDTLEVWIRTELNGENLAAGRVDRESKPQFQKSWNQVPLEAAYEIASDCPGLYFGYSFYQKKRALGLSIIDPADLPTQENALFVQLGENAEWEDRHDEGTASVEAIVVGENLPQYNLVLKSIEAQDVFVIDRGTMEFSATIRSIGVADISGFNLECTFDDYDAPYSVHIDQPLSYGEEATVSFIITPDCYSKADDDIHSAAVVISSIDEGDDVDVSNNSGIVTFTLIDYAFYREILLEEFTTEKCSNCPGMAQRVHEFLETYEYADRVNMVCHHAGYYTDWLTIPADSKYLWLYNQGGSTYAPALMIDRYCSSYTGTDTETSPIVFVGSSSQLEAKVDRRLKDDAFVSVKIRASLPEDASEVTVTVTGARSKEDFTKQPPRIVVGLIEDSIKALSQAGAAGEFYHMHVNRAYNDTWGEEIEWDGNEYTYTCTLPVESGYVREHLSILAYVWDYDPDSVPNCEVCNSASLTYDQFDENNGISSVAIDSSDSVPCAYYTLDGRVLSAPQSGFNIIRYSDGSSHKVFVK